MRGLAIGVVAALAPAWLAAQTTAVERFGAILRGGAVRLVGPGSVRWLPGSLGYLEPPADTAGRWTRVDPLSGRRTPFLSAEVEALLRREGLPLRQFEVIRDGRGLAFRHGDRQMVVALDSAMVHRIPIPAKTGPLDLATEEPGRFSPDWRRYAFIRDYDNLWLFDPATGAESPLARGTSEDNLVGFLGAGPWWLWSPRGDKIAYLTADQTGISRYPLLRDTSRAATVESIRYPFTTDPNPTLELHIVDLTSKRDLLIARSTVERPFLRELEWISDGRELAYQVVDQWEDRRELMVADAETGATRSLLIDTDPAYLDPIHNFRVLADGRRFLFSSEKSGRRQIYLHDRGSGAATQLTDGPIVTKEVVGVDEAKGRIYFVAATELGLEQHLYRVGLDGRGLTRLTEEPGWHAVSLDPAMRVFVDRHSSLGRPWSVVLKTIDGRVIRGLAHSDTSGAVAMTLRRPELLSLVAADGRTPMHALMYRPADFDSTKRYPVIVSVYGGPHTKAVRDQYASADYSAAIAQLGFLVLEIDGRGTLDREKSFQTGNYLRLGQVDVDDQAAAVRQLAARRYLDARRVGITGISHGGYLTLMALLRHPDVFQVGVSGAPITDLRNGPRQYIGRMMRTPAANPEGYALGDPLPLAAGLEGRLLVMYGTDDRNALGANVMSLLRRLIDAGRPVDVALYPLGSHVLTGADAVHGLKTTVSYFLEHLKPDGWEETRSALWR